MHVVFLCNEYPPGVHGGVGSLTQTIARRLVRSGHHATVAGMYQIPDDRTEDDQGVRVLRLAARSPVPMLRAVLDQRALWHRLADLHRTDPIDVAEGPEPALWAAPVSLPYPLIVRMNGGHLFFAEAEGRSPARARTWVEARSIRRADDLIAVSRYVGARTVALLGLRDRPVTTIPNPVDVTEFHPDAGPSIEAGTVLFFGTVCEKKGVRQLVLAFPAVAEAVPTAQLVIAGRDVTGPSGSFTEGLRTLVPPDLADRVRFRGPVEHDRMATLIAQAEVCALPSHMEALPVAWIEALASGKALVASTTGPGPEVVEDGVSGLLVDPYDPAAMAAAVIEVLRDPARRDALGAAARARAVERFSVDVLIDANVAHYDRVRAQWSGARA